MFGHGLPYRVWILLKNLDLAGHVPLLSNAPNRRGCGCDPSRQPTCPAKSLRTATSSAQVFLPDTPYIIGYCATHFKERFSWFIVHFSAGHRRANLPWHTSVQLKHNKRKNIADNPAKVCGSNDTWSLKKEEHMYSNKI